MDRAGLSANDGPTHHGLFDIAYLRCVPNIVAMAPRNEDEFADMLLRLRAKITRPLSDIPWRGRGRAGKGRAGHAGDRQGGGGPEF